jgi:hypothetical protein
MNANASAGPKVLPIAKIPIKKTGRLITNAEATGKSAAGRQPPSRLRSQNKDGAYASAKSSAAMTSEVMVVLLMSALLKLPPSTVTNMNKMAESPISHEPIEMQSSFIEISVAFGVR